MKKKDTTKTEKKPVNGDSQQPVVVADTPLMRFTKKYPDASIGDMAMMIEQAYKLNRKYRRAIKWACGQVGDFPQREEGQGAYWWRPELRKRSGL